MSLVNENPYQARIITLLNGTFLSLQSSEDQFYIYFIHVQKYLLLHIVAKKIVKQTTIYLSVDLGNKICSTNLIHSNNLTAIFENYVLNSKKLGTTNLKILF